MGAVANVVSQHKLATGIFGLYALCWLWVAQLSGSAADSESLDACGRGTLMVYPVLFGFLCSLPYWLGLLVAALKLAQGRFYLYMLASAVALPLLLTIV